MLLRHIIVPCYRVKLPRHVTACLPLPLLHLQALHPASLGFGFSGPSLPEKVDSLNAGVATAGTKPYDVTAAHRVMTPSRTSGNTDTIPYHLAAAKHVLDDFPSLWSCTPSCHLPEGEGQDRGTTTLSSMTGCWPYVAQHSSMHHNHTLRSELLSCVAEPTRAGYKDAAVCINILLANLKNASLLLLLLLILFTFSFHPLFFFKKKKI